MDLMQNPKQMLDGTEPIMAGETFGKNVVDKTSILAAYCWCTREVEQRISTKKALFFDAAKGRKPLRAFLDALVPYAGFAHHGISASFWVVLGGLGRRIRNGLSHVVRGKGPSA